MSDHKPITDMTEDAPVQITAGRTVLGFTLSQMIGAAVLIVLATSAWLSLKSSIEASVAEQKLMRGETTEAIARVSTEFTKAINDSEARSQQRIASAKELADSERKNITLQQDRQNDRISNVASIVESFRPIIAIVPTLDQRTAAVERVGANVQELALAVRTQQAVSEQLVETNKEIKSSLVRLNDKLTANPPR